MDQVIINGVRYIPEKESTKVPKVFKAGDFVTMTSEARKWWGNSTEGTSILYLRVKDVLGNTILFEGPNDIWYDKAHFNLA